MDVPGIRVSVSADGSKGVKLFVTFGSDHFSRSFSIRRWIEGCEAVNFVYRRVEIKVVSVSADGSKGVKLADIGKLSQYPSSFSIRRWIEGCEAS